jgi:hypothetical protein
MPIYKIKIPHIIRKWIHPHSMQRKLTNEGIQYFKVNQPQLQKLKT